MQQQAGGRALPAALPLKPASLVRLAGAAWLPNPQAFRPLHTCPPVPPQTQAGGHPAGAGGDPGRAQPPVCHARHPGGLHCHACAAGKAAGRAAGGGGLGAAQPCHGGSPYAAQALEAFGWQPGCLLHALAANLSLYGTASCAVALAVAQPAPSGPNCRTVANRGLAGGLAGDSCQPGRFASHHRHRLRVAPPHRCAPRCPHGAVLQFLGARNASSFAGSQVAGWKPRPVQHPCMLDTEV